MTNLSYDEMVLAIRNMPDTYLPDILQVLISECDSRPVFRKEEDCDGLSEFLRTARERALLEDQE